MAVDVSVIHSAVKVSPKKVVTYSVAIPKVEYQHHSGPIMIVQSCREKLLHLYYLC